MSKVIVFDLDETLGYFYELSIIINALETHLATNISTDDFNKIMELFPEFIRPNMLTILRYLSRRKANHNISKVLVYTNNKGPLSWVERIINYFHHKLKSHLFDQIIGGFRVNGKMTNSLRTTRSKTYADLVRCARLPKKTHVCFIDDQEHKDMIHDNVYYICIKPFIYSLEPSQMIKRLHNSKIYEQYTHRQLRIMILDNFHRHNYNHCVKNNDDLEIDKITTKRVMTLLQENDF